MTQGVSPYLRQTSAILLLILGLSTLAHAQHQISAQHHSWYMYFGNHRLSEHWGVHTEYQWRRMGWGDRWQQSLMRIGAEYYTKSGPQFTVGYGWIRTFPYGDQPIAYAFNEHRIWEQMVSTQTFGRFTLNHRFRLEQRWLETKSAPFWQQTGFTTRQRFRYRFLFTLPLTRKTLSDRTLFAAVYDEFFIGFGKGIDANALDQNRLYAALGWRFNSTVNVQLGYLNQYVLKPDGIRAERNHTLQVGLTCNLEFREAPNAVP